MAFTPTLNIPVTIPPMPDQAPVAYAGQNRPDAVPDMASASRTGLAAGTNYSAVITVTPGSGSPAIISVTLTIPAAAAALSLSASALDFGSSSTSFAFGVRHSGGGTLSYTVSDDAAWLTVSPATGTSTGEHDVIGAPAEPRRVRRRPELVGPRRLRHQSETWVRGRNLL